MGTGTGIDSPTCALYNKPTNIQIGQELTEISSKHSRNTNLSISQSNKMLHFSNNPTKPTGANGGQSHIRHSQSHWHLRHSNNELLHHLYMWTGDEQMCEGVAHMLSDAAGPDAAGPWASRLVEIGEGSRIGPGMWYGFGIQWCVHTSSYNKNQLETHRG